ncbi:SMP-30/gluconolactonase/LRE family protein [Nocardioides antri]|uniref:SMP-30/gluconolactonase/LRE family protein n=1 Tax=Nocardioides antri TaxID=2607659 RepID=A0A5B1MAZ3_9ACTN|nr:SMP-30/gluconolactonase/LRE family protein [Nocardioides antri]KAA1429097.1 SMP-30/gluconolactonase/LRE family protein [Nocardioides antri]
MTLSVIPVPGHGTEDVCVATSGSHAGWVYTGTADGAILRVSPDGAKVDRVALTGGRPMGIELAPDGRLLVCDARRGLLWVDPASGAVELIADSVDGVKMRFCNNAAVAADGTIWFSDSSQHFGFDRWKDELLRDTRTGRLLRRDPDGSITTVLTGLAFANGVALAADESFVCVAETGARTVVRHWLAEPRTGMRDKLCSDLPGYPDNIALGSDGLVWVTISSPTDPLVERIQRGPMVLRKVAARIPEALQPGPKRLAWVRAYDATGALVHDLRVDAADHGASYQMVSGVREHEGRVWLGSLEEPAIAVIDL